MGNIENQQNWAQKDTKFSKITQAQVESITPTAQLINSLKSLMTPKEIIEKTEFERPRVIHPSLYPDFASLLSDREEIRNLRLLPAKSEEEYQRYHSYSQQELTSLVTQSIGKNRLVYALNQFPYLMPDDTEQGIVWIGKKTVKDEQTIGFIAQLMVHMEKTTDEVILYERPLLTESKLVRGTIPSYRHIHMWLKV